MWFKFFIAAIMLTSLKFFFNSFSKPKAVDFVITQEWWNDLSDEWKTILSINQSFQKHGVDIFEVQKEYVNRLSKPLEPRLSTSNSSLYEWHEAQRFSLSYVDFCQRAIRTNHITKIDSIDLATLGQLETIYMVNGPGDLSPLVKLRGLKTLILNYGGIANDGEHSLDLKPLIHLRKLKVLHCSSVALKSLDPIKSLSQLEELYCDNSSVTTLAPLRNMTSLRKLRFGSRMTQASAVSTLYNLEELYMSGCANVPDLSRLRKLRQLFIAENELAIVSEKFRLKDISFLKSLHSIELLDFRYTSYRGNIDLLADLPALKAITLPRVSKNEVKKFKDKHPTCVLINAYEFE